MKTADKCGSIDGLRVTQTPYCTLLPNIGFELGIT